MATLIKPSGECLTVLPARPPAFTLMELHALVGGYVECIPMPDGTTLVVDEEGQQGAYEPNLLATAMAMANGKLRQAGRRLVGQHGIVGDALFCGPTEIS